MCRSPADPEGSASFTDQAVRSFLIGESVLSAGAAAGLPWGARAAVLLSVSHPWACELEIPAVVQERSFLSSAVMVTMWLGLPSKAEWGASGHVPSPCWSAIAGSVCVPITGTLGWGLFF